MKFNVELDLDEYCISEWFSEDNFVADLKSSVLNAVIDKYVSGYHAEDRLNNIIKDTVNSHNGEIINAVIDNVTKSINRRKTILALKPKSSELTPIEIENEEYVTALIKKVITSQFK